MRYKLLGRSGLRVSELCFGAMTFGEEWGFGADRAESARIFEAFTQAGGNFIDTANRYTEGTSEKILSELIARDRERIVLATKYTLSMNPGDPNACGNQRKNMVQALEASLKRLKTDYVDLYWVHAPDGLTPVEEVMRALDDQVRLGKVFYVGISDAPAWWVARANTLAELRGWTPFVGLQLKYSLIERSAERDLLPMARALDLAVTTWGSLGGGLLSGKYQKPEAEVDSRREGIREQVDGSRPALEAILKVAAETSATPAQVALAWVRQQKGPPIIPIVGARTARQLEENLGCLKLDLSPQQLAKLSESSPLDPGFPHTFLNGDNARGYIFGNTEELIDNHRR